MPNPTPERYMVEAYFKDGWSYVVDDEQRVRLFQSESSAEAFMQEEVKRYPKITGWCFVKLSESSLPFLYRDGLFILNCVEESDHANG